ncbi:MAG: hypothetical protein R3D29_08960 [Nitratireductor sp.]
MMRYPRARTEAALLQMARYGADGIAELDYVNPETGTDVLPTMGFTAMYLAAGQGGCRRCAHHPRHFSRGQGQGASTINGKVIEWSAKDTFTAPVFAEINHMASEDSSWSEFMTARFRKAWLLRGTFTMSNLLFAAP